VSASPLVEVDELRVHYPVGEAMPWNRRGRRTVKAVEGVSLHVDRGETLALVGESGCGKSTLGRAILQIVEVTSGSVRHDGVELTGLRPAALRPHRRDMQMIFQDPYSSLNPYLVVSEIIGEPMRIHGLPRAERDRRVVELLDAVHLRRSVLAAYPHELSGGMRQRVGIARALALGPHFIVCDEPVAALDVSVQAEVVNLLQDLQAERELSYLFISHDLGVVRHIADRVAVMYLGRIVETAPAQDLFAHPGHPYTRALLSAIPRGLRGGSAAEEIILDGTPPSPVDPPSGCPFRTRCPFATDGCAAIDPALQEIAPGHLAARCPALLRPVPA
jgi:oligopeptide transport system ATP-binding protein